MRLVNETLYHLMGNSSAIRKMFELGIELKKKHGANRVFDFSLGNPDLPPPPPVADALRTIADDCRSRFAIGYMPNAGYPAAREAVAAKVSREQEVATAGTDVVMTCGAAGGLNVFFKATLAPGDEVVVPAPYFVEYGFYVGNAGGKLIPAPSHDFTFELDFDALARAITPRTRAIILNSPNNPTGRVYTEEEMLRLSKLLEDKSREYNSILYLVSDEPYRFLNFTGEKLPSCFAHYKYSIVCGSCSKNLSLAGERVGYIAVNPAIENRAELLDGLIFCNRTLGFVNAPAIGQKLLVACLNSEVDAVIYRRRRDAMAAILTEAGIKFTLPQGAFYFFAKSPIPDEREFAALMAKHLVLIVPGRGFGTPGYFRLAFCVEDEVIHNSRENILAAMQELR
ncbi:MAG: pyridoxal phosphate-dependent aminotransferase [Victivallaceae bacterium]|nr:pyridoxal phosphate-dependent aminotransferase [Victivallaceae bacterium]